MGNPMIWMPAGLGVVKSRCLKDHGLKFYFFISNDLTVMFNSS